MTTLLTPSEALSYSHLLLHLALDTAHGRSWSAKVAAIAARIAAQETQLARLVCRQEALLLAQATATLERCNPNL
ncbi:hypothetical protein NDI52_33125 [Leptolyngbya sp. PL-A3]|uniref:hypothetical protein n=1 Tax=Leptolyngbya sp. PL-A3 TaxID=2933911 RepID=UPI003297592D